MLRNYVFISSNVLNTEEPCQTPSKAPGTCILVKDCGYLLDIVKKNKPNAYDIEYLRKNHCGYDASTKLPKAKIIAFD